MSSHPSVLLASDSSGKKRKASDDIPELDFSWLDDELESIGQEAMEKTVEEERLMAACCMDQEPLLAAAIADARNRNKPIVEPLAESTDEELMQWTENPPTLESDDDNSVGSVESFVDLASNDVDMKLDDDVFDWMINLPPL